MVRVKDLTFSNSAEVSNAIKLNSTATKRKDENKKTDTPESNTTKLKDEKEMQTSSLKERKTNVLQKVQLESRPTKAQLSSSVDLQGGQRVAEKQKTTLQGDRNEKITLKSDRKDLQLLGGLTKTRTRGRAGRKPPSRSARKGGVS